MHVPYCKTNLRARSARGWQGGAAADGVQARFEAIAARLGWEQKMLKRTPSSLYFCYKKPLARRELGPLLPPLK